DSQAIALAAGASDVIGNAQIVDTLDEALAGCSLVVGTSARSRLQQHVPQYDSGQEVSENQLLAALRFVTSLEHLRQQQPLLTYQ
ncbi:STY4199 family HEPN domain-containing protein, partial [Salmonella enterica subsp. enterica serovar Anatum]|nr:STY4199 family HEPN domain-containing protein [Salmonella enterica subsp. enterica serovar Anatum]